MAHPSARLTPHGRQLLVDRDPGRLDDHEGGRGRGDQPPDRLQVVGRFRREGEPGLADRTSAVHHQARAHPAELVERLCARRRELRVGPHILAWEAGLARSTVYAFLRREGLGRLDRLEPRPPVVRYERERPGELVHLDTKMLGRIGPGGGHRVHGVGVKDRHRGIGWNRVHIAIDDHTPARLRRGAARRVAGHDGRVPAPRLALLRRPRDHDRADPHRQRRLLSQPRRSPRPATSSASGTGSPGPYRPQTNGKAERMVRTLLKEWAYARPFADTADRIALLPQFLDFYNRRRPHW